MRHGSTRLRDLSIPASRLVLLGCLPATAAQEKVGPSVLVQFEHLWQMVVVEQMSRGAQQEPAPPVRRVCQYGLSNSTAEMARFMLRRAKPAVYELEIRDAAFAPDGVPVQRWLAQLNAEFGSRVQQGDSSGSLSPSRSPGPCDLALFSEAAPHFSIDRLLPRLGSHVVVAWVSEQCVAERSGQASPTCNLLNTMWSKTSLMRRGYCLQGVCMSRVPTHTLRDPNVVPLDCDSFLAANSSGSVVSEFGQDWYLFRNFLQRTVATSGSGVYVDVGASLPFDYSNTVVLDRCLGWQGVCIEANPYLAAFLRAYRSCTVFPHCADERSAEGKAFVDHEGNVQFTTNCLPLGEMLTRAGLRGRRIDVLSIDIEQGELGVLRGLPWDEFDIRLIVVEVMPGARWLEVDTAVLPRGYAKVAVLGRDVVYAKLEELSAAAFADWPLLSVHGDVQRTSRAAALPQGWAEFHQRVVDEELEQEMRQERKAFYEGLRRR